MEKEETVRREIPAALPEGSGRRPDSEATRRGPSGGGGDARPARPPLVWCQVTLTVPERLATFMEGVRQWDWLGAHIVIGRGEFVRELVNMAKLAKRIEEKGPLACAKGVLDFGEFARRLEKVEKQVRAVHREMNQVASDIHLQLPRFPRKEAPAHDQRTHRRTA